MERASQRHRVDESAPHGLTRLLSKAVDVVVDIIGRPATMFVATAIFATWFGVSLVFDEQVFLINLLTVLTFLLLFPLQHSQNRDSKALHAKIDELISALPAARNELQHLEKRDEEEIERTRR